MCLISEVVIILQAEAWKPDCVFFTKTLIEVSLYALV